MTRAIHALLRWAMVLLLALCCAACVGSAGSNPFADLPLLRPGAVREDTAFRVRVHQAGQGERVLVLILRADADLFAFTALDELGLPLFSWPNVEAPLVGGIDPGVVARMIQLALASDAAWQAALADSPWRLEVDAAGERRVLHRRERLVATVVGTAAVRRLSVCPAGFAGDGACAADGVEIEVQRIEP